MNALSLTLCFFGSINLALGNEIVGLALLGLGVGAMLLGSDRRRTSDK